MLVFHYQMALMDRFERIKKLGEGATGTVYKAYDNVSGLLVALKVPEPPPDGINPSMHYAREVDLLKSIDHSGIVKIIDSGLDDGKPWVAYEFLKGNTLRELIASGKTFSVEETIKLGRDIARSLAYIHNRGIIHRDINPNNIMITTDGKAKIMDFGIALKPDEPLPKQLAGTPGYMSPEAARGEESTPESDVYSLGLILY
jgi:eukaryotic-like serine/threonine-protein kinase